MLLSMPGAARNLLAEIEAFLEQTGLSPTKFGLAAVNDGHLVANLRKGTSVTLKTADRVRAYMARWRPGTGRRRRRLFHVKQVPDRMSSVPASC